MSALIEFQSVCKYYQMGDTTVKAADHISFQIQKGEFVAIVGQSGSGKSTCMNIIGCLDVPTSGAYLLDGQDVNGGEGVKDPACLAMTTESLTREFPLYTPSLLNLVKTSETHVKGLSPQE